MRTLRSTPRSAWTGFETPTSEVQQLCVNGRPNGGHSGREVDHNM
jgi:hypothetical protein